jgi:hypothetical protein|tara:strand:- start:287 stop:445 length:159 start_codon:yes stop_codon:yes gene_type:complete
MPPKIPGRQFPEFMTPFRVTTEQKAKAKRMATSRGFESVAAMFRAYLDAEVE